MCRCRPLLLKACCCKHASCGHPRRNRRFHSRPRTSAAATTSHRRRPSRRPSSWSASAATSLFSSFPPFPTSPSLLANGTADPQHHRRHLIVIIIITTTIIINSSITKLQVVKLILLFAKDIATSLAMHEKETVPNQQVIFRCYECDGGHLCQQCNGCPGLTGALIQERAIHGMN